MLTEKMTPGKIPGRAVPVVWPTFNSASGVGLQIRVRATICKHRFTPISTN